MTGSTQQGTVDGMLIRGGTSKGLYVAPEELPPAGDRRDRLLVELFGTPDPLQIDGLGGGNSHTSKVMVVEASDRPEIDVEYTFGQIAVENPTVDWTGNCGNLTSGVGVYAILNGLVEADAPEANLRLYNTNTDTVIEQTVPVVDGEPAVRGDYAIDGVPGTGARIDSYFRDPSGAVTGDLLPSGSLVDEVTVQGETYEVSLVDVANLNVFLRASDLGLDGTELPAAMDDPELLERIELLRGAACELLGLVEDRRDAVDERAAIPQIALVSEPQSAECTTGDAVDAADVDVTSRIVTTQTPHHSYAMTGAMCLAAASQLPGTIPNEFVRDGDLTDVTIGHPKGRITVGVETTTTDGEPTVEHVRVGRTSRLLVDGDMFYRYVDDL
ncbi:2-methylaconitate cis-trans isomerase PrpF family protein [Halorientalis halophila]|uniref:2-methylaconitate cis-trans isomerase PrpF family protein n=1 Tax=Halorientalis halophila TaxID=3108499 RepID=UPI00300BF166